MIPRRQIIFRVDSSGKIGLGHLSRCISLACAFREFKVESIFISQDLEGSRLDLIEKNGFILHSFQATSIMNDAYFMLKKIEQAGSVQLVIVDSYDLDRIWEDYIRPHVAMLLVIDDLANRVHNCDYLLDHNPGSNRQDYIHLIPQTAKMLMGAHFALLNKNFYLKHKMLEYAGANKESLRHVLICCGGSDPLNITGRILDVIMQRSLNLIYHVVIGKSYHHRDVILKKKTRDYIFYYDNTDCLVDIMSVCQLAIGSGGITALERCSLGMASIIVIAADNQIRQVNALVDESAVSFLDIHSNDFDQELCEALLMYQNNPSFLLAQQQQAFKLCDGAGSYRVISALYSQDDYFDGDFYLRPADREDAEILLNWQQYPGARRYSRNTAPPTRDEHYVWFDQFLRNGHMIMILMSQNKPVGFIRLDSSHDVECDYEISILISHDYQGRGFATRAVSIICHLYSSYKLYAHIQPENNASIALFKKNGFVEHREGNYIYAN